GSFAAATLGRTRGAGARSLARADGHGGKRGRPARLLGSPGGGESAAGVGGGLRGAGAGENAAAGGGRRAGGAGGGGGGRGPRAADCGSFMTSRRGSREGKNYAVSGTWRKPRPSTMSTTRPSSRSSRNNAAKFR